MKKLKVFIAALILFATAGAALAEKPPVLNPYGKYLVGEGLEIQMAQFAKKNKDGLYDVLLRMTGPNAFNAGMDGKTFKYEAQPGSDKGINYKRNGKAVMIVRKPYGDSWSIIEVYLDGQTISVREDKEKSKEVMPLHLLTDSEATK